MGPGTLKSWHSRVYNTGVGCAPGSSSLWCYRHFASLGHSGVPGSLSFRGVLKLHARWGSGSSGVPGCLWVLGALGSQVSRCRQVPPLQNRYSWAGPQGPLGLRVPASRARVTSCSGREPSSVYFRPPAGLRPSEARAPRSHGLAHGVSGGCRRSAALCGAAANVANARRRTAGSRRGGGSEGRPAAAGRREAGRAGGRRAGARPGPQGAVPRGRGPSPRDDGPRVGRRAPSFVGLRGACESSSAQMTFF